MIDTKKPFKFAPGNYVRIENSRIFAENLSKYTRVPYTGNFISNIISGVFKVKRRKYKFDQPYYNLIPVNYDFAVQGRTRIASFSDILIFPESRLMLCSNLYSWQDILKGGK